MKVILLNGSPDHSGSTYTCLKYIKDIFFKNEASIDVEFLQIPKDIQHCNNCRLCKNYNQPCLISEEYPFFKEYAEKIQKADGIIIGSPVYYYSITSQLQAFITRLCYSCPKILEHKLCSFFSVSRRSGNTNAFDQMMKIFQMHNAIMIGGNYVNEIYADNPEELQYDKEGLLSLRMIAQNFITIIPLIKEATFYCENKVHTNFISREFLQYVEKEKEYQRIQKLTLESY